LFHALKAIETMDVAKTQSRPALAPQGLLGILLISVCWPLNWGLPGMRTAYLFFPLWLGYILLVDGLVLRRRGTSLLQRSPRDFALLFVASAPAWWLFEAINSRTHNWQYLADPALTPLQYYTLSSLSFSTVMPAVFETAELVCTFRWISRLADGPRLQAAGPLAMALFVAGLVMLGLTLSWPRFFYPMVWLAIFFILEPLNLWRGKRHLFESLRLGDWRPLAALSLGALICGFFWEMWNYFSYPKWVYHTPGAEFARIFEMPLLGYLGYLPFAWELFSLRNALWPRTQPFRV
jgi:hypothetical protein